MTAEAKHDLRSVTKSVISALVDIAHAEGGFSASMSPGDLVCSGTGISKLKPALALLPMVRPIAASLLLGW